MERVKSKFINFLKFYLIHSERRLNILQNVHCNNVYFPPFKISGCGKAKRNLTATLVDLILIVLAYIGSIYCYTQDNLIRLRQIGIHFAQKFRHQALARSLSSCSSCCILVSYSGDEIC